MATTLEITRGVTHHDTILVADASDAGFLPGVWPNYVTYEGIPFARQPIDWFSGEIVYVDYRQDGGLILRVYND